MLKLSAEIASFCRRIGEGIATALLFGFPIFQVFLAKFGGFRGIHAGFQFCLFKEIAPALVAIRGALTIFQFLDRGLHILAALNNLDYSRRLVGADIVPDDDVRVVGFVAFQEDSVGISPGTDRKNCRLQLRLFSAFQILIEKGDLRGNRLLRKSQAQSA